MRGVREDNPGQFQAWRQAEERNEGWGVGYAFLKPCTRP
jgi:hypothetical protein